MNGPPGTFDVRTTLQARCMECGDPGSCELTLEQLEKDLQISPGSVVSLTNSAGALGQLGDLARAEAMLRRALAADPKLANTHFNLGLMLEKQGRLPEARAEYEETLRLEPSRAAARERLTAMGDGERAP